VPVHSAATTNNGVASGPSNLHVLVAASHADQNLCKVLLSVSILGYSTPAILNWGQEFDDPSLVDGGAQLEKIHTVHEYLASLDATHNDDVVLVLDGYDAWVSRRHTL